MTSLRPAIFGATVALFLLAIATPCLAQIKLYLKDGSYELVKTYEIRGDRVRYYSVERSDWEEIPVSLVDFQATQRAQKQKHQEQQEVLEQAAKTEKNTYQLGQNGGYEIASGLRLPSSEGVYAYDGTRVITLLQSQGELARDKKRLMLNMALPAPILKTRMLVLIPGKTAAVRIFNPQPAFYVQFADNVGATFQLLQLKVEKQNRVVEALSSRPGGKAGESREPIAVQRRQLAPGLFELKPLHPLSPGEYALGEINENKLNLNVWDFGIASQKQEAR